MSNDVYLIQKETLDNIARVTADLTQYAGGLTPEEITTQLNGIEIKDATDCTVTGNVVQVPQGLFQDWTDVTVGTAKPAATYTPTTTNQVINAGNYLTGAQTIAGDADLTAANIKSGVNIFGVAGTYTSDATATAARMLSGYTAYAKGAKITGNIATKTSSNVAVSGRTVTIPAGYYASQVTKNVGTAVAGVEYTPTTTDRVLAAGSYLTSAYTIKGDADLIPSNIKSGVEIFGVTGTYEGGGSYLNAESYTF